MRQRGQSGFDAERTGRVITWLCARLQAATLRPGDPIAAEESGTAIRAMDRHVRAAVNCLCALGILRRRSDSVVIVAEEVPPLLLELVAARCASSRNDAREALQIVATQLAGLAAERATHDHHTIIAEEVAAMYAAGTPDEHLEHAVRFHRVIARASGNSLLAAFAEALMISEYADRAIEEGFNLRESARLHNEIYRAIRRHQPAEARRAMKEHGRVAVSGVRSERCPEEKRKCIAEPKP